MLRPPRAAETQATRIAAAASTTNIVVASVAALVAVGVAQVADLMTFVRMVALVGIGAEQNPIVAHAAETHGMQALVLAKLGVVALVVVSFALAARAYPRVAAVVITIGTLAGLLGAWSNVVALLPS
jgi:hypothetical protein